MDKGLAGSEFQAASSPAPTGATTPSADGGAISSRSPLGRSIRGQGIDAITLFLDDAEEQVRYDVVNVADCSRREAIR